MIEKIMLSTLVIITLIRFFVPKAITNYYLLLPETKEEEEEEEEEVCFKAKKKKRKEVIIDEEDDAGGNIWCKLDRDMLGEITKRLGVSDQARFRSVCKTWLVAAAAALAPQTSISNIYTQTKPLMLPWYVYYSRLVPTVSNTLELQIYYPSSSSSSSSSSFHQIISLTKLGIPTPPCYRNIGITCHRNWFIISIAKHHEPRPFANPRLFAKTRRYYFIYSFITKKIIKLPIFSFRPGCSFIRTFTTHDPRSPSCVFILLNAPITDSFVIVTCRKGDRVWTAREFPNIGHDAFRQSHCYPLFFGGMLYIVSPFGQLASYNILDGEFSFVSLEIDFLFALNLFSLRRYEIFELNGELMIFYFGSKMKHKHTFPGSQCLKQFDWSNKVWIPVSSLGGKTLFVGNKINSVAILSTEQMRCNGILSNKIYHFFDDQCTIYSLVDGYLVKFKSINLLEDGAGNLIAYKDNNNNDVIPWGIPWDIEACLYLEPPVIVV